MLMRKNLFISNIYLFIYFFIKSHSLYKIHSLNFKTKIKNYILLQQKNFFSFIYYIFIKINNLIVFKLIILLLSEQSSSE
jgi:hypothetical protein